MDDSIQTPERREFVSLQGKAIVVTGAARGIGSALARQFAEGGAEVLLTDVSPDVVRVASEITADGWSAVPYVADLLDEDAPRLIVDAAQGALGRLDGLVNCAGINIVDSFQNYTPAAFAEVMRVNVYAPFFLSQAASGEMTDGGSIVNISSIRAWYAMWGGAAYATAKAALNGMTRQLAHELAPIRVNSIAPGIIDTPMTRPVLDSPVLGPWVAARLGIPRAGQPEDLVGLCALLLSDAARYITGATYTVDGGFSLGGGQLPED